MNLTTAIHKCGDLYKVISNYDEEKADDVCSRLIENCDQMIEYNGKPYFFDEFHYDGLLVFSMEEERQIYIGKWWIQNIKVL